MSIWHDMDEKHVTSERFSAVIEIEKAKKHLLAIHTFSERYPCCFAVISKRLQTGIKKFLQINYFPKAGKTCTIAEQTTRN